MNKIVVSVIAAWSAAICLCAAPPALPRLADGRCRICILGSCSGTEPMPNRHHTAWTLEYNGRLYQFDAGEGCAYTAYLGGVDLVNLRALFISHPHIDHNAGLPHLLMVRRKSSLRSKRPLAVTPLPIYTPSPAQIEALLDFMTASACGKADYRKDGVVEIRRVADGTVFDDGSIKVEAVHNRHVGEPVNGQWLAFSYKITAGDKKIVFSGDVKSLDERSPFLGDCAILLMETGHHHPWKVAEDIRKNPAWHVRRLVVVHHGRDILERPQESARRAEEAGGGPVEIADEMTTIEL